MKKETIPPRLLRMRDAPGYLSMNVKAFNKMVRPFVNEIRIGVQGVAFDRLELDAWVDDYIARNGTATKPGSSAAATVTAPTPRRHSRKPASGDNMRKEFESALARARAKR